MREASTERRSGLSNQTTDQDQMILLRGESRSHSVGAERLLAKREPRGKSGDCRIEEISQVRTHGGISRVRCPTQSRISPQRAGNPSSVGQTFFSRAKRVHFRREREAREVAGGWTGVLAGRVGRLHEDRGAGRSATAMNTKLYALDLALLCLGRRRKVEPMIALLDRLVRLIASVVTLACVLMSVVYALWSRALVPEKQTQAVVQQTAHRSNAESFRVASSRLHRAVAALRSTDQHDQ